MQSVVCEILWLALKSELCDVGAWSQGQTYEKRACWYGNSQGHATLSCAICWGW